MVVTQCSLDSKLSPVQPCATGLLIQSLITTSGRAEYGFAMDLLSKAFNMVEWRELFTNLVNRGVQPILLRVLLYVYRNQQCDVKWGGSSQKGFLSAMGSDREH